MCDNSASLIGWLEEDKDVLNNIKTLIEIYRKDNISEDKIKKHVESILIETGIQFSEKSLEEILK